MIHRMWPVTDMAVIAAGSRSGPKPVFIADGHHRYETACNYRDELQAAGALKRPPGQLRADDVRRHGRPRHGRAADAPLVPRPAGHGSRELIAGLGDAFTARSRRRARPGATVWDEIEREIKERWASTPADDRWVLARITAAGRGRMAKIAAEHSQTWRDLGVSILHRLVIDTLLEAKDLPKPRYVHLVEEVVEGARNGRISVGRPGHAGHGRQSRRSATPERMPAKSTYFYPKLLSGLVLNPLE